MTEAGPSDRIIHPALLWFGVGAGAIAWTVHLVLSYLLVPFSCSIGTVLPIHVVTLVAALITAAALVVSLRAWHRSRTGIEADVGAETGLNRSILRSGFMALSGVLLSGLFLLLILVEGVGPFFLDPCQYLDDALAPGPAFGSPSPAQPGARPGGDPLPQYGGADST